MVKEFIMSLFAPVNTPVYEIIKVVLDNEEGNQKQLVCKRLD